jgi:hypothetical protein
MIRLDVWLTLASGESIKAGALITGDPDAVRGDCRDSFVTQPST